MEVLPPLPDDHKIELTPPPAPALGEGQQERLPDDLAFTPVPRQTRRVTMAARATGNSAAAWYALRRATGADQFTAAWDSAIEAGARRVLDTLVEHAIHGTPETLTQNGEVILERRRYNHRAMMWIVAHRFPDQFGEVVGIEGHNGLSAGLKRLKAKWRKQWEEEQAAAMANDPWAEADRREIEVEAAVRVLLGAMAEGEAAFGEDA